MDGVTLTVVNYARWLDELGCHPLMVTPRNPVAYETDYRQLRYFSLPIWNRYPYRYGYPRLDFRIWRDLRREPLALAHSHSPFSAGRLALYAARHHNVPLIGTFHSKYRTDLEHSFRRAPWMTRIIMHRIRSFFEACDEIWIPQAQVEETVRSYGIRGKVTVMENGNDFASYPESELIRFRREARKSSGIPDDVLALLFVGQHIWEKGVGVIVRALSMLPDNVKFRMDFIGTGYALEDLRKLVVELGLQDRVYLHGTLQNRDQLARHYAAADLFLFPSFYDNAPLVVREAAAMGTPSVLLKGSTASEVITDGINGFLTGRSPEDYAAIISRLAGCPEAIADAGRKARATLVRDWNSVMEEVMERYARLISEHK